MRKGARLVPLVEAANIPSVQAASSGQGIGPAGAGFGTPDD
jgi:hypothetical protein